MSLPPVTIDAEFLAKAEKTMKRCQRGVGGRWALDDAHDIMADAYGTIGRMVIFFREHPHLLSDPTQARPGGR